MNVPLGREGGVKAGWWAGCSHPHLLWASCLETSNNSRVLGRWEESKTKTSPQHWGDGATELVWILFCLSFGATKVWFLSGQRQWDNVAATPVCAGIWSWQLVSTWEKEECHEDWSRDALKWQINKGDKHSQPGRGASRPSSCHQGSHCTAPAQSVILQPKCSRSMGFFWFRPW